MTTDPSIYEEEEAALAGRESGGGGGSDFTWMDLPKPAKPKEKFTHRLRIVQRLNVGDDGEPDPSNPFQKFWVRVDCHRFKIDGQNKMLVCPDNHDTRDRIQHMTCPICKLANALWKTKKTEYQDLAKTLFAQGRCYANVIDMEEPASHWKEVEGGYDIRPKVWGYSLGVQKNLISMCKLQGAIEDVEVGRSFAIEIERVGTGERDIRYPRCIGLDREPLSDELMPVAQRAWDLEGLSTPASMEDLRSAAASLDPGIDIDFDSAPSGKPASKAKPQGATPPGKKKEGPPPPPNRKKEEPANEAGNEYHYTGPGVVDDQALDGGIVTSEAIASAIANDPTPGVHLLWSEGWPDWVAADEFEEFSGLFAAEAPEDAIAEEEPAEEEEAPEEEPAEEEAPPTKKPAPPPPPGKKAPPAAAKKPAPAPPPPGKKGGDSAAPRGGYAPGEPRERKGTAPPPKGPPKPPPPPGTKVGKGGPPKGKAF